MQPKPKSLSNGWDPQVYLKSCFIFVILLYLTGCGYSIEIDNATSSASDIRIDDKTYVLQPGETQSIRLQEGKHTIGIQNPNAPSGDTIFSVEITSDAMIQIPGGRYWIWKDVYGDQTLRDSLLNSQWQVLDSTRYNIDIELLDTLQWVHIRRWDYGLLEQFPQKILLGQTDKAEIKRKLIRINDFAEAYKKQSQK